jgi:hypothetical protein
MDKQPNNEKPVTLESLLRLKRHEKPAPEFWNAFEREFKQRQLLASVKRESWSNRIFHAVTLRHNPVVPLTAAALLIFGAFLPVSLLQTAGNRPDTLVVHSEGFVEDTASGALAYVSGDQTDFTLPTNAASHFANDSISSFAATSASHYHRVPAHAVMQRDTGQQQVNYVVGMISAPVSGAAALRNNPVY